MFDVFLYVDVPVGKSRWHTFTKGITLPFAPTKGLAISSHIDEYADGIWWVYIATVEWNVEAEAFWAFVEQQDYYACDTLKEAKDWWVKAKGWEYFGRCYSREMIGKENAKEAPHG